MCELCGYAVVRALGNKSRLTTKRLYEIAGASGWPLFQVPEHYEERTEDQSHLVADTWCGKITFIKDGVRDNWRFIVVPPTEDDTEVLERMAERGIRFPISFMRPLTTH